MGVLSPLRLVGFVVLPKQTSIVRGKLLVLVSNYLISYFLLPASHLLSPMACLHAMCPTVWNWALNASRPPSPPRHNLLLTQ